VTPDGAAEPTGKPSADRMMEISDRFAKYPVLDPRTPMKSSVMMSSGYPIDRHR
jgi:hypothetical protein